MACSWKNSWIPSRLKKNIFSTKLFQNYVIFPALRWMNFSLIWDLKCQILISANSKKVIKEGTTGDKNDCVYLYIQVNFRLPMDTFIIRLAPSRTLTTRNFAGSDKRQYFTSLLFQIRNGTQLMVRTWQKMIPNGL